MIRPATARQREYLGALIVKDVTANQASRLIGDLKRERVTTKALLAAILEAKHGSDRARLGSLLAELKARTAHGEWLEVLNALQINPRRAQRLMVQRKGAT